MSEKNVVAIGGKELEALARLIAEKPEMLRITSQSAGMGDVIKVQRMTFKHPGGWQPDGTPEIDISDYESW